MSYHIEPFYLLYKYLPTDRYISQNILRYFLIAAQYLALECFQNLKS